MSATLRFIITAISLVVITALVTWFTAQLFMGERHGNDENKPASLTNRPVVGSSQNERISLGPNGENRGGISGMKSSDPSRSGGRAAPSEAFQSKDDRFRELATGAASNGDYSLLQKFFEGLSQNERYGYIRQIPGIFSKFGPAYDIREKMALLDKVNVGASSLASLRGTILQMEARERYDQMKEEGILGKLTDKEFAGVCRSIATSRVKRGFAAVEDAGSESAKRAAAVQVAQAAIAGGTMEASKEIGALPAGIVRDEAAAELVLWLRRTGSASDAEPWEKLIVDEKAKARLGSK